MIPPWPGSGRGSVRDAPAGSATEAGLQYALTGETTLNIASLSDIAGVFGYDQAPSVGMVEMRLGGEAEHRFFRWKRRPGPTRRWRCGWPGATGWG